MLRIILPQAIKIMMPNFINQFVISLKDTTIISVIGVLDLVQVGRVIIARNMQNFNVYIIIGIMYLAVILSLTKLANILHKLHLKSAEKPLKT
ncbi:MAG: ABC transporter permease subunit [Candidatus Ancillula trichonymphae]|jgi:polar amino acid transport system substrate-binding protein|nr:ABC transporter permease subunit [Candidatus Ancillula trichonymphae]